MRRPELKLHHSLQPKETASDKARKEETRVLRKSQRNKNRPKSLLVTLRLHSRLRKLSATIYGLVELSHRKRTMRSTSHLLATFQAQTPPRKPMLGTSSLVASLRTSVQAGRLPLLHSSKLPQVERKEAKTREVAAKEALLLQRRQLPQLRMPTISIPSRKTLRLMQQLPRHSRRRQRKLRLRRRRLRLSPSLSSFGMSSHGAKRPT